MLFVWLFYPHFVNLDKLCFPVEAKNLINHLFHVKFHIILEVYILIQSFYSLFKHYDIKINK